MQFLNDSEISGNDSSDVAYDNPQVFLLSGWGEPGSAASDEEDEREREGDRRFWSCWCAAHRPPYRIPSEADVGESVVDICSCLSLIIGVQVLA